MTFQKSEDWDLLQQLQLLQGDLFLHLFMSLFPVFLTASSEATAVLGVANVIIDTSLLQGTLRFRTDTSCYLITIILHFNASRFAYSVMISLQDIYRSQLPLIIVNTKIIIRNGKMFFFKLFFTVFHFINRWQQYFLIFSQYFL